MLSIKGCRIYFTYIFYVLEFTCLYTFLNEQHFSYNKDVQYYSLHNMEGICQNIICYIEKTLTYIMY